MRQRRVKGTGSIRRLESGRWQARVRDEMGCRLTIGTYRTKTDADRALMFALTDRARGAWVDPRHGQVTLCEYAPGWLTNRPSLRPRTRELYDGLLRLHILPVLGHLPLAKLTPLAVRKWHASMTIAAKPGPSTVAKAYRLLHTILGTAVDDELIVKNPCRLKGAGVERTPERPIATVAQVDALANEVEPRFRALVLVATYTTLRLGELLALTRRSIDLLHGTIRVVEQAVELSDGTRVVGPPKTAAGTRTVSIPPAIIPDLEHHLAHFAGSGPDGLVFCGERGASLRRQVWNVKWRKAVASVGPAGLHFHDLRHTGNTLAASTGASTKELMARMGHSSPRAALIYQHATAEREDTIARALSDLISTSARDQTAPVVELPAPPKR